MRNEANGFVGRRRTHVGEFLLAGDIDVHILFAGIFADDHAFVDVERRADEKFTAFLDAPKCVSGADASAVSDERARGTQRHFAAVIDPAFKNGMNERGAARVGKQLAAQADESARRNPEFEADAAGAVIAHLGHFATARAERFHDDADEVVGDVDDDALLRLEFAAVFVADDDFGLADHELEAFAAHGFDQDGELEFAAAEDAKGFGRVGIFYADGDVGEQLFLQAIAEVAGGEIAAFAAGKRAGVDGENHRERRLVDDERLERGGAVEFDDAFADLNAFDAGNGDDVAG